MIVRFTCSRIPPSSPSRTRAPFSRCSVDAGDCGAQRRSHSHHVLGPLLNDYLGGMTDVVFAHDGTVAKIVGDAIHMLLARPPSSPTMRRLRWRVHWRWIQTRNCFAIDGGRKRSHSALPASAYMQARPSLVISAVAVFLFTPHTAMRECNHSRESAGVSGPAGWRSCSAWEDRGVARLRAAVR
jgi:hypothetical protein